MKKRLTYLLLMIFCATYAVAQNVTISPQSGHLISAYSYDGEVGFEQGWGALWRHCQLPLTLLVSDKKDLTSSNTLKDPAGNICLDEDQGLYVIDGGTSVSTYMNISLPKGFRFTHYRIVLLNNINGKTINETTNGNISKELRETSSNFSTILASSGTMSGTNDNKEYVIERTSRDVSDMGNNLYFYFSHSANGYYGATIKSIELDFTAQGPFTANFTPTSASSSGVNVLSMAFDTGRPDLGEISRQQKNGKTFLGYHYRNVKDLTANAWLYQEDAVVNNALPSQAGRGNITIASVRTGPFRYQYYYALGNGTYYIESPTSTIDQTNNSIPLGYRITGAKVNATAQGSTSYNISIYGTDKDNAVEAATINSNSAQTLTATNLNNDAVKIVVSGLGDGQKALMTFSLDMEALNPFVRSFDVVAHANNDELASVRQTYDTNDFKVSGNKLDLHIPEGFTDSDNKVKVSFDNLNSQYATTDYNVSDVVTNPHARVYFVGSEYYNSYGDGRQYDADPNAAASTKVSTLSAGDKPFIYSNAADLDRNSTTTSTSLKEYPFSLAKYSEQGGTLTNDVRVAVGEDENIYLFVGDETRYNIAPTKAMEHRYYAYYTLNMELEVRTYTAQCTLKKIYDKTCYDGDREDAMYGASFQATDADGNIVTAANGATLGVQQMKDALNDALAKENVDAKHVLYLDFGNLANVLLNSSADMATWKDGLNANCLVFLPSGVTFTGANNIVRRTATGGFQATGNIVITDKQPFYAPYEISVPAENYATYTRNITLDQNGKVANASIILPFELALTDGIHTNRDNSCSFMVSRMSNANCLTLAEAETAKAKNYVADAKFTPVSEISTKANVPYIVTVTDAPTDVNVSFIATQYGSKIAATPTSMSDADYTFKGEESTGTINGATYSFINYGSYSGKKLDKKAGYFYFSGNMFLCSKNLVAQRPYLYVYPFRAYYAYRTSGNTAKGIDKFGITFDDGTATGIADVTADGAGTSIRVNGDNGAITLIASEDADYRIVASTGATVSAQHMRAGETRTVTVPSGLYIVNNKKVLVK